MQTNYFDRRAFRGPLIAQAPPGDLGLMIVIPAFDEPHLLDTLKMLYTCQSPRAHVEVIIVINHSESTSSGLKERNAELYREVMEWTQAIQHDQMTCHPLYQPDLPSKKAGVGLARKIGMDEAARRAILCGKPDLPIVCLDADCSVSDNYLAGIEGFFAKNPRIEGCSVHFEHPLGNLKEWQRDAIIDYELHLRCMIEWQRWAGFPFAFHTVGSSMAVRAQTYVEVGGMNTRQAGEDFYFLQKVIERGRFGDCTGCTVFPSPRISERVPFGTGRAILGASEGQQIKTYNREMYEALRQWCATIPQLFEVQLEESSFSVLPKVMKDFLVSQDWRKKTHEIRLHTASEESFVKRVHRWFNAFRLIKFAHFAREHGYPDVEVEVSSRELAKTLDVDIDVHGSRALLDWLRDRVKNL